MKAEFLFIWAMVLMLGGCAHSSKTAREGAIPIDLGKAGTCSFYDIFSRMDIIPLETNEESLLAFRGGEPYKMVLHNGKFFFLDKEGIFIFNSNGGFENKIHKPGKGPGEYLVLNDFIVNRFTGDIELLSAMGYINVYDSLGMEFKKTIRLPEEILAVHYFMNLTPDVYVFFADSREGNKMLFYSVKENKILGETYDVPVWLTMKTILKHNRNPFYVYDDTVYFAQVYDGNIFTVNDTAPYLTSKYAWDLGEHTLELSVIPPDKDIFFYLDFVRNLQSKYATLFMIYSENAKYYFTNFTYKNKPYHLVINKQRNNYMLFEKFEEGFRCMPFCVDEKAAYFATTPNFLNTVINPDLLDEENLKRYRNIQSDDNPIVVKYTFK